MKGEDQVGKGGWHKALAMLEQYPPHTGVDVNLVDNYLTM